MTEYVEWGEGGGTTRVKSDRINPRVEDMVRNLIDVLTVRCQCEPISEITAYNFVYRGRAYVRVLAVCNVRQFGFSCGDVDMSDGTFYNDIFVKVADRVVVGNVLTDKLYGADIAIAQFHKNKW